jgi:hypothetical protein
MRFPAPAAEARTRTSWNWSRYAWSGPAGRCCRSPRREVLARHTGHGVTGVNVPARGVYADEGFWVGTGGDRL